MYSSMDMRAKTLQDISPRYVYVPETMMPMAAMMMTIHKQKKEILKKKGILITHLFACI